MLDTVELDMILNSKRIEDTFQMEDIIDPKLLLEQNQKLVAAVTVLVDTIKTQMDKNSGEMPKAIVDSFNTLKSGVETLLNDKQYVMLTVGLAHCARVQAYSICAQVFAAQLEESARSLVLGS